MDDRIIMNVTCRLYRCEHETILPGHSVSYISCNHVMLKVTHKCSFTRIHSSSCSAGALVPLFFIFFFILSLAFSFEEERVNL